MEKVSTSYRLTPEGKRLLEALAEKMGVSHSAALEMVIRRVAKQEKVE